MIEKTGNDHRPAAEGREAGQKLSLSRRQEKIETQRVPAFILRAAKFWRGEVGISINTGKVPDADQNIDRWIHSTTS